MKRIILLLTLSFIVILPATAQKQASIWYFGKGAGIQFINDTVIPIKGGQTGVNHNSLIEGSSTISDSEGNLLFYSWDKYVWNRYHEIMPNGYGLLGHWSCTQGSIIVPKPGSNNLFYLFTLDGMENKLRNGLNYSIIDMSLDNCKGDVVPGRKNLHLLDRAAEKIAVIQHSNRKDYWIVTHHYGSDRFHAFLLTSYGISDEVVTSIGPEYPSAPIDTGNQGSYLQAVGQLKASSDGKWLAVTSTNISNHLFDLFSFDNQTGIISNHMKLEPVNYGGFSLEFSPNSNFLYRPNGVDGIDQYDLTSGNQNTINSSVYTIPTPKGYRSIMQLGPDGRIYFSSWNDSTMSVILEPNLKGASCNLIDNYIRIGYSAFKGGFNQFIAGFNYNNGVFDTISCASSDNSIKTVNAFSPNGDGLNDTFTLVINTAVYGFNMTILNRWGEILYESTDINQGWDGTYQGYPAMPGIYFYQIKYRETPDGEQQTKAGMLYLMR